MGSYVCSGHAVVHSSPS
ncbi:hypothetical protein E2C01_070308 [Portunus trituberculatus]|uniref:Uncharacterized protein n=1 Tax=Portunus trituberculatus TaxID=210409 RepID=A0A5B7I4S3_PORTR|nr:hypothetical protein [Portunus trituberculatus]